MNAVVCIQTFDPYMLLLKTSCFCTKKNIVDNVIFESLTDISHLILTRNVTKIDFGKPHFLWMSAQHNTKLEL